MKKLMFVFAGLLVSVFAWSNEIIAGKVVTVIDGNTIEVTLEDNSTYKIMLQGIDCPELGQEFGDQAKSYLEKLLLDKPVTVEIKGKDRWGTRMGVIIIGGATDPRFELLNEGLAWTAEVNPNPELEVIKEKARNEGKGLWKQHTPTAPWAFRRQQTRLKMKSS